MPRGPPPGPSLWSLRRSPPLPRPQGRAGAHVCFPPPNLPPGDSHRFVLLRPARCPPGASAFSGWPDSLRPLRPDEPAEPVAAGRPASSDVGRAAVNVGSRHLFETPRALLEGCARERNLQAYSVCLFQGPPDRGDSGPSCPRQHLPCLLVFIILLKSAHGREFSFLTT